MADADETLERRTQPWTSRSAKRNAPDQKGTLRTLTDNILGQIIEKIGIITGEILEKDECSPRVFGIFDALLNKTYLRDPLTELYSFHHFNDELQKELNKRKKPPTSETSHPPCCVVMCDLNSFKKYNAEFGHDTTDQILAYIAEKIEEHVTEFSERKNKPAPLVARRSGDEFLIILPETGAKEAVQLMNRLNRRLSSSYLTVSRQKKPWKSLENITLAFGICPLKPIENRSLAQIRQAANQTMENMKARLKDIQQSPIPGQTSRRPIINLIEKTTEVSPEESSVYQNMLTWLTSDDDPELKNAKAFSQGNRVIENASSASDIDVNRIVSI